MMLDELNLATRFAESLDRNDFVLAKTFLSDDCVYHDSNGSLRGKDEIIAMYQANYLKACTELDTIDFTSKVEKLQSGEFLIHYFDRISKGSLSHLYQCDQRIQFVSGKIAVITHVELPGERERLGIFKDNCEKQSQVQL